MRGSGLRSLVPASQCVPDPAEDYEDYRVVAAARLSITANTFPALPDLTLPAAAAVPLGNLVVSANRLQTCDCGSLQVRLPAAMLHEAQVNMFQDLARHAELPPLDTEKQFGQRLFKQEFYSSSLCVLEKGNEIRLKQFARENMRITDTGWQKYKSDSKPSWCAGVECGSGEEAEAALADQPRSAAKLSSPSWSVK